MSFKKFLKSNRPAYATRSKAEEVLSRTPPHSTTLNNSKEVHKTEISTTDKAEHDNRVTGEIYNCTTQFSDQNITIDQRDSLHAYKATSDLDTLYLHEAMKN